MGLYGNGMHDYILTEAELGPRAAMSVHYADVEPDGWFYDVLYEIDCDFMEVTEQGFRPVGRS